MYWIVQIFLLILAITTGINLAVFWDRKNNGDENYSYDDATKHWPNHSRIFYINYFFQQTAGNMIFAIFVEGLLYFCGEIENPLAGRDGSFSEDVYEAFLNNNCIALIIGRESYDNISKSTSITVPTSNKNDDNFLEFTILNEQTQFQLQQQQQHKRQRNKMIYEMNCDELSEKVSSLGTVYLKYSEKLRELGITGQIFLKLTEDDLRNDFNVHEKYHIKGILSLQTKENLDKDENTHQVNEETKK